MNKNVLRKLSYGVYVVSTKNGEKHTGCVANSIMQVTHDTIAISINHENYTNKCIKETKKFGISILSVDVNDMIIPVFGFQSGKNVSKFDNIKAEEVQGIKVLKDSTGYIICDVVDKMETETHTVFLGKIVEGDILKDEIPMTYAYYHQVKKGTSPKAAPTFIEENLPKEENKIRYKCEICGYIYEGEDLPEDFICPLCKHGVADFEPIE